MRSSSIQVTAGLVATLSAACVTGQATAPSELTDARLTYGRVSGGEAAKLVPAQVHIANRALQNAERAFAEDPAGSQHTRDLAYIAQRQAQLAEINAQTEVYKSRTQQASEARSAAEAKAGKAKQTELKDAKQKLAQAQLESKSILSQLSQAAAGSGGSVKESERGLVITLAGNVLFDHGKASLLAGSLKQLDEIAHALVDAKSSSIQIEGFTDSTGSAKINEQLSQKRAEAVRDYLAKRGIPANRIHAVGRGASNPIDSNDTAEGRAANRRVELIIQGEKK